MKDGSLSRQLTLKADGTKLGLIGWFNIWDSQLTSSQIAQLSPSLSGNVVSWETLEVAGSHSLAIMSLPESIVDGVPGMQWHESISISS